MSLKVYRCAGWAAYDGHCGSPDCETCYPGSAHGYVAHESGQCRGWPSCRLCEAPLMCDECGDEVASQRGGGKLWCDWCAEDCCDESTERLD